MTRSDLCCLLLLVALDAAAVVRAQTCMADFTALVGGVNADACGGECPKTCKWNATMTCSESPDCPGDGNDCDETCSPAVCGNDACKNALVSSYETFPAMFDRLKNCQDDPHVGSYVKSMVMGSGPEMIQMAIVSKMKACGLDPPLSMYPAADTCLGAFMAIGSFDQDCPCPGRCKLDTAQSCSEDEQCQNGDGDECDDSCSAESCGTNGCATSMEYIMSNAHKIGDGVQECASHPTLAPHVAPYAQYYTAESLQMTALDKLGKCELPIPKESRLAADSCAGGIGMIMSFDSVCGCSKVCANNETQTCNEDSDCGGGECEDSCSPADCGTAACRSAMSRALQCSDDFLGGLSSCTGHLAQYAQYAQYGASMLSAQVQSRLQQCGLTALPEEAGWCAAGENTLPPTPATFDDSAATMAAVSAWSTVLLAALMMANLC